MLPVPDPERRQRSPSSSTSTVARELWGAHDEPIGPYESVPVSLHAEPLALLAPPEVGQEVTVTDGPGIATAMLAIS